MRPGFISVPALAMSRLKKYVNGRKDFVGFSLGLVPFIDVAFEGGFVDFADPHIGVTDGSIGLLLDKNGDALNDSVQIDEVIIYH